MDRGKSLLEVAAGFAGSQEFKSIYGASPTNTQLVDQLYKNVLGRAAEPAGVDYWVGVLNRGASTAEVLANISESAENKGRVASTIGSSGIELDASYFII